MGICQLVRTCAVAYVRKYYECTDRHCLTDTRMNTWRLTTATIITSSFTSTACCLSSPPSLPPPSPPASHAEVARRKPGGPKRGGPPSPSRRSRYGAEWHDPSASSECQPLHAIFELSPSAHVPVGIVLARARAIAGTARKAGEWAIARASPNDLRRQG